MLAKCGIHFLNAALCIVGIVGADPSDSRSKMWLFYYCGSGQNLRELDVRERIWPWSARRCGDVKRQCRRSVRQIENYRQKISDPLLDRIDIHIDVPLVDFRELASDMDNRKSSAVIRDGDAQPLGEHGGQDPLPVPSVPTRAREGIYPCFMYQDTWNFSALPHLPRSWHPDLRAGK